MVLKRGTTIVLAVLVLWMLLAIAGGIATILINSLRISGTVDASVVALYAADAGVECFLHQERINASTVCDDGRSDTPCVGCALLNNAVYGRIAREKIGATVRLQVTGAFRDTNRGLEVSYEE